MLHSDSYMPSSPNESISPCYYNVEKNVSPCFQHLATTSYVAMLHNALGGVTGTAGMAIAVATTFQECMVVNV